MKHRVSMDQMGTFGSDLLTVIIGILLLVHRESGWTILYVFTLILCLFVPLRLYFSLRSGAKPKTKTDVFLILFDLSFGFILLMMPDQFLSWMHVFFGWWMLGHGCLMLINFYVTLIDRLAGGLLPLVTGLFSSFLGGFMIFSSNLPIKTSLLSILAGIYFLLYGLLGFLFHLQVFLASRKIRVFSWSYSAPVFFNAFLPLDTYITIKQLKLEQQLKIHESSQNPDLHVYIYLKGKGPEALGHIDISYHGTIWSYGCHDPQARHLFGTMGDGVLIRAKEQSFIQESITTDGKTVIDYGIVLNDEQKKVLENRISSLLSRTVPWKCSAAIAHEEGKPMTACTDYASRVYRETFCDMFKFASGKFRTYFIASTNCVLLADELIRNPQLNLIDLNGLVTPGAYLAFLNTEYLKPDSIVVSRSVYEQGVREAGPPFICQELSEPR